MPDPAKQTMWMFNEVATPTLSPAQSIDVPYGWLPVPASTNPNALGLCRLMPNPAHRILVQSIGRAVGQMMAAKHVPDVELSGDSRSMLHNLLSDDSYADGRWATRIYNILTPHLGTHISTKEVETNTQWSSASGAISVWLQRLSKLEKTSLVVEGVDVGHMVEEVRKHSWPVLPSFDGNYLSKHMVEICSMYGGLHILQRTVASQHESDYSPARTLQWWCAEANRLGIPFGDVIDGVVDVWRNHTNTTMPKNAEEMGKRIGDTLVNLGGVATSLSAAAVGSCPATWRQNALHAFSSLMECELSDQTLPQYSAYVEYLVSNKEISAALEKAGIMIMKVDRDADEDTEMEPLQLHDNAEVLLDIGKRYHEQYGFQSIFEASNEDLYETWSGIMDDAREFVSKLFPPQVLRLLCGHDDLCAFLLPGGDGYTTLLAQAIAPKHVWRGVNAPGTRPAQNESKNNKADDTPPENWDDILRNL